MAELQRAVLRTIQDLVADELVLHLYRNDATPTDATTLTSFVEISGWGYSPKRLLPSLWSVSRTREGWRLFSYGKEITFEFTGAGALTVYGYFVTRRKDGALVWADRLHPPGTEPLDYIVVHNPGDAIGLKLIVPIWVGALGI